MKEAGHPQVDLYPADPSRIDDEIIDTGKVVLVVRRRPQAIRLRGQNISPIEVLIVTRWVSLMTKNLVILAG